jgi:hypothetical protein
MDISTPGKAKGNAGKGRKRGSRNKLTRGAKEAFEHAFNALGGSAALAEWAAENRTDFYKLFARLIPQEQRHADPNGEPVSVTVSFVDSCL